MLIVDYDNWLKSMNKKEECEPTSPDLKEEIECWEAASDECLENEEKDTCPNCKSLLLAKFEQTYDHWREYSCGSLLLETAEESIDGKPNIEHSKDCIILGLKNKIQELEAQVHYCPNCREYCKNCCCVRDKIYECLNLLKRCEEIS